jgi:hypothetical protein
LSDFFSLLNHDVAGQSESNPDASEFIQGRKFAEVSGGGLTELDRLADLLASAPEVDDLIAFYRRSPTLRFLAAEEDSYSFLNSVS